jgi:hypothetical protein
MSRHKNGRSWGVIIFSVPEQVPETYGFPRLSPFEKSCRIVFVRYLGKFDSV